MATIDFPYQVGASTNVIQSTYKGTSTADADEAIINVDRFKVVSVQTSGLIADTLSVYVTLDRNPATTNWFLVEDEDSNNPFAAPSADILENIEVANYLQLKIVRTSDADGSIDIFVSGIQ